MKCNYVSLNCAELMLLVVSTDHHVSNGIDNISIIINKV